MKATRIPGTSSFNLTLSLVEIQYLVDELGYCQLYFAPEKSKRLINLLGVLEDKLTEQTTTDDELVDGCNELADIMTEENKSLDDIIDRASAMPLTEAILFFAKELKFPVFIDTEDEDFKWAKNSWDSAITYEEREQFLRDIYLFAKE